MFHTFLADGNVNSSPFFNCSYEIIQSTIVLPEFLFINLVYIFTFPWINY